MTLLISICIIVLKPDISCFSCYKKTKQTSADYNYHFWMTVRSWCHFNQIHINVLACRFVPETEFQVVNAAEGVLFIRFYREEWMSESQGGFEPRSSLFMVGVKEMRLLHERFRWTVCSFSWWMSTVTPSESSSQLPPLFCLCVALCFLSLWTDW